MCAGIDDWEGLMRAPTMIAAALAAIAVPSAAETGSQNHHWSYSGHDGPSHWGQLDSAYSACATGKAQSPINIRTKDVTASNLPPLVFNYRPVPLSIVDNGHTIQANYEPGSALLVGGKSFELVSFHFHHPSEEEIDGKRFDMVAHLVHRDAQGQLAVVAVPLTLGRDNPLLATLWSNLPKHGDHGSSAAAAAGAARINAGGLVPSDHSYYTFGGSLTTPPCSEGVHWMVLKTPMEISKAQIATFASRYPNNARPEQRLNGRHVLASK
jgi:carbonic anhydrase